MASDELMKPFWDVLKQENMRYMREAIRRDEQDYNTLRHSFEIRIDRPILPEEAIRMCTDYTVRPWQPVISFDYRHAKSHEGEAWFLFEHWIANTAGEAVRDAFERASHFSLNVDEVTGIRSLLPEAEA